MLILFFPLWLGWSTTGAANDPDSSHLQKREETPVFRWIGSDGVVEFNDYGVGEEVRVTPQAPVRSADAAIVRERQREILEVARILADERSESESRRDEKNAALAQQKLAAMRATEPEYYPYPSRVPNYLPYWRRGPFGPVRQRREPRYVYAPGPDHPSRGLRPFHGRRGPAGEGARISAPRPAPPIADLIR